MKTRIASAAAALTIGVAAGSAHAAAPAPQYAQPAAGYVDSCHGVTLTAVSGNWDVQGSSTGSGAWVINTRSYVADPVVTFAGSDGQTYTMTGGRTIESRNTVRDKGQQTTTWYETFYAPDGSVWGTWTGTTKGWDPPTKGTCAG